MSPVNDNPIYELPYRVISVNGNIYQGYYDEKNLLLHFATEDKILTGQKARLSKPLPPSQNTESVQDELMKKQMMTNMKKIPIIQNMMTPNMKRLKNLHMMKMIIMTKIHMMIKNMRAIMIIMKMKQKNMKMKQIRLKKQQMIMKKQPNMKMMKNTMRNQTA